MVTPYADYFAQSSYANTVSLVVSFLVITPVLTAVAVLLGYYFFSTPAVALAHAMFVCLLFCFGCC
jgi:hypothetical protein